MKLKLVILLALTFLVVPKAHAQSFSVGVYPPILQIEAEPPANVDASIVIQNLSDQSNTYIISMTPFKGSEKMTGEPIYIKTDEVYKEFFDKVQIQDEGKKITEITLSPRQSKKLNLHASLPKGESLGDYYFSIIFISKGEGDVKQSFLGTKGGIAVNVLFKVGPKLPASGLISEFSTPNFITKGPVPFGVTVKNSSPSYISIKGNVVIKNMFGQAIGQVDLLPLNILAKSERIINSTQANESVIWPERFLLGFYKAELSVSLSDEGPILRRNVSFFAFPAEGIIGLLLSSAIVFVIIRRVRKKSEVF